MTQTVLNDRRYMEAKLDNLKYEQRSSEIPKKWYDEAWRLYGYYLMGVNNHREVAEAMSRTDELLKNRKDVKIVVSEVRDETNSQS